MVHLRECMDCTWKSCLVILVFLPLTSSTWCDSLWVQPCCLFPPPFPAFILRRCCCWWPFGPRASVRWYLIGHVNCLSLRVSDAEHSFRCLMGTCILCGRKHAFHPWLIFLSVVCVFETDIHELFLSFKDEFFVNNFVGKYIFFSFWDLSFTFFLGFPCHSNAFRLIRSWFLILDLFSF